MFQNLELRRRNVRVPQDVQLRISHTIATPHYTTRVVITLTYTNQRTRERPNFKFQLTLTLDDTSELPG